MSGKIWKKLLAAGCAMSLLATAPGMTVLADQISEDEVIVTDAEDPELLTDFAEDPGEDVIDEDADELSEEETLSVENGPAEEVDVSPAADEEEVGTGDIIVGDGVTATFDEETGTVEFYSEGGTLSEYWKYELSDKIEDIKSIKVASGTVFLPEDSDSIFSIYYEEYSEEYEGYVSNLEEFDSSGFDTSNVTSMYDMFEYCNKLTALDLSNFDTSKVRNMGCMFNECTGLEYIDFGSFDTSSVTNMYCMFKDCESLANLDLSSFNTSNVTDMDDMFRGCSSLTDLNLSSFDTSNVTDMNDMFCGCSSLTNLNLSSFDTSNTEYYHNIFYKCKGLISLRTPQKNSLTINLPVAMYDESGAMYSKLPVLSSSITLTSKGNGEILVGDNVIATYDEETGAVEFYSNDGELWNSWLDDSEIDKKAITSIKVASGTVHLPSDSRYIFSVSDYDDDEGRYVSGLIDLDLSGFDTSNVTDMKGMFTGCSSLKNIDLKNFNTSKVTSMWGLFAECESLNELDLSAFDTTNVTNFYHMFSGCTNLISLDISSFVLDSDSMEIDDEDYYTDCLYMFDGCNNLSSVKTPLSNNVCDIALPVVMCDEEGTLYYSLPVMTGSVALKLPSQTGQEYRYNVGEGATATFNAETGEIVIYSDGGTLWKNWLSQFDNGTILSIRLAETSSVYLPADSGSMFCYCYNLSNLDLKGFDTSNVTNMTNLFSCCYNLEELDISGFNTAKVQRMDYMFDECHCLTELDLSNFDTVNVNDMGHMFDDCYSLMNLNLSSFNTRNVRYMRYMFRNCNNLTNLDLSSFVLNDDAQDLPDDPEEFDWDDYENRFEYMFDGCEDLISLKTPMENNAYVELPFTMYDESGNPNYSLPKQTGSILLKKFPSKLVVGDGVTATYDAETKAIEFYSDEGTLWSDWIDKSGLDRGYIESIKVASGTVHLPADCRAEYFEEDEWGDPTYYYWGMFYGCENLKNLDLSGFDSSNVTNMEMMFSGCRSLKSLDLSGLDTSNVTDVSSIFNDCSNLTELNLGSFNTSNVTDMNSMFNGCSNLTNLDLSNFNTLNVTDMSYMFNDCYSLTELNLGSFDTSNVTDMSDMFGDCINLTNLDLSNFNTSNVTDMSSMFYDCYNLTELNLSNFNTSNVTDMRSMFHECNCLTKLELSNVDTSNVGDMAYMFSYCYNLTNLDLSNFNTTNVTDMNRMFYSCSSLTNLDFSSFDTSNVTDMSGMFGYCESLTNLNLSNFDTSNVTDMNYMFYCCSNLTNLDLSNFDTSNVTDMGYMFNYCSSLTNLNLSGFDTSNLDEYNYYEVFYGCDSLSVLNTPKKNSFIIDLPITMYDETGNEYTSLPVLSESITLTKDRPGSAIGNISDCTVNLETQSYTYDGKEKKPTVTVNYRTAALLPGTDYSVTYSNNTNAGIASVKVEGIGNYQGEQTVTFIIGKADSELIFASSSVNKTTLDAAFTNNLTKTTDGTVTFNSSDIKVATVDSTSGKVTIKGEGTATITATAAEGTNYKSGSAEYTLTVVDGRTDVSGLTVSLSATSYTYDGKAKEPTVTVKNGSTALISGTDYTVSYADNTNAGTATATVTGAGKYKGEKSVAFTINKAEAVLAFAENLVTKESTDAAFINTLTKTTDGSVTFKSSNTNVATVNSASGLVTIKGAGTATITATASEGKNYKAGSAAYTLKIEAPAPTATPTPKPTATPTPKPTATPTPKPTATPTLKPTVAGFSDVQDPKHAYYKAIYWAADAGITKGYPDGTFGINRSCTRGEMMMFLWRYAGKPAAKNVSKSPFKDVPKTHTFYKAILWGSQKGITKGYSDGTFGVNRNVSRGECMMFLWRLRGKPAPKAVAKSPFSDVPKTHVFYNAILWGAQKKITTGYTSGAKKGTFGINENCTRGQIVTFLYRAK